MNLRTTRQLVVFALCSLGVCAGAAAQSKPDQPQPPAAEAPPIAGKATLGLTIAETELVATGWRASKLLHADVYNDAGQKIGKVDDFIVTPDGKLSVAVVEVGGFLGIGAHRVAIPVEQLGKLGPKVVLPRATKENLKQLPEFKYLQR